MEGPSCGADILVDDEALDSGEVDCPACGIRYAMDLSGDEEEEDAPAEE